VIKDIWVGDLALIELLAGKSEAPADVLNKLEARGQLLLTSAGPELTSAGQQRAQQLKQIETDLRAMFTASGRSPVHTDAGPLIHIGGGVARIRA
jgi:hypothetical protein